MAALEIVRDVSAGRDSVELRGGVDRAAQRFAARPAVSLTKPVSLVKAIRTVTVGDLRRGDVLVKGANTGVVVDRYRIGRTLVLTVLSGVHGLTQDQVPENRLVDIHHQPATRAVLAAAMGAAARRQPGRCTDTLTA